MEKQKATPASTRVIYRRIAFAVAVGCYATWLWQAYGIAAQPMWNCPPGHRFSSRPYIDCSTIELGGSILAIWVILAALPAVVVGTMEAVYRSLRGHS
jgi:hypothetical protein